MIGRIWFSFAMLFGLWVGIPAAAAAAQDATPAGQDAACATLPRAALAQFAADWNTALDNHDLALLERIVSPEIVHHAAAFGDTGGVDDLETVFDALATAFPDAAWTTNLTLVDDPYVVFQSTVTGAQTGVFQGMEPTGKTVTWDTINLLRIECGRIVESWSEIDQVGRLQQLGLMPNAAANVAAEETATGATPAACAVPTRAEAEALLAAWWNEGWRGDARTLDAIASDQVIHHWASGPDSVGTAAQEERIDALLAGMPDMAYTYGEVAVDGHYAAAVWQGTGTQTGEFMGQTGNGKTATWNGINIFRIECGEIAEVWSEMDSLGLIAQLAADGATPAATPTP